MEEEDDDFYGGPAPGARDFAPQDEEPQQKMEVTEEQDEEEEEEDSDDDVQFTLEKPEGDKAESSTQRPTKQPKVSADRAVSTEIKQPQPGTPIKQECRPVSTAPTAIKTTLTHNGKEGSAFPEIRTSTIDVNSTPLWPTSNKPITAVDIDADLAEHSKPWRLPGTDQTDFFNYGFDEYTWAQYCVKQQTMGNTITDLKESDAKMKAWLAGGAGPGGGMPGMPQGMPPMMPGMPPMTEEMMMQMMMAGGGMPGGMPPGGPGQPNQQGGGGYGPQGGNFGGSGQNSVSPNPQAGQGFQPPSGPAAQNHGGDPGGFGGNMEGYSPQQLAIMQQQQQGGGRRGGRGRGRYY